MYCFPSSCNAMVPGRCRFPCQLRWATLIPSPWSVERFARGATCSATAATRCEWRHQMCSRGTPTSMATGTPQHRVGWMLGRVMVRTTRVSVFRRNARICKDYSTFWSFLVAPETPEVILSQPCLSSAMRSFLADTVLTNEWRSTLKLTSKGIPREIGQSMFDSIDRCCLHTCMVWIDQKHSWKDMCGECDGSYWFQYELENEHAPNKSQFHSLCSTWRWRQVSSLERDRHRGRAVEWWADRWWADVRIAGWWFQTFFIFHNIWDNPAHWLIFFKMV